MKRLFFMMVVVNTMIISTLSSCTKDNSLPDHNTGGVTSLPSTTLNLTADHWEKKANGIFVNTFISVIPAGRANLIKVYLVTNGNDTLITQPIRFMDGELWATNTQTDIGINYRGNSQNVPYLNIKVVFE